MSKFCADESTVASSHTCDERLSHANFQLYPTTVDFLGLETTLKGLGADHGHVDRVTWF